MNTEEQDQEQTLGGTSAIVSVAESLDARMAQTAAKEEADKSTPGVERFVDTVLRRQAVNRIWDRITGARSRK